LVSGYAHSVGEPSRDEALTRRWRRPTAASVVEVLIYAVTVALLVWPAPLHLSSRIIGASDDTRYYTWLGWRIGKLIAAGHIVPTRIPDVIVPFGLDLRLLDGYLPSYVAGLWNLVVGPFTAFNLTVMTGAVLNIVAARSLARRLSERRLVWVIATVALVTAAPIALSVQQGLLTLFWVFPVIWLLADAIDVVLGRSGVRPVRLAALLLLAYLCSVYFLVFGGLLYVVIVAVAAARDRRPRLILPVAAAFAATALLLTPFVVARFQYDADERAGGGDTQLIQDANLFSADPVSVVAQPTRSSLLVPRPDVVKRSLAKLPDLTDSLELTLFPGVVLLVGSVLFVTRRSRLRVPLVAAAAVFGVLVLGPSLRLGGDFVWHEGALPRSFLPYRLLLAVPGLGALRAPYRASYVLVPVLAAATAVALDRMLARSERRATVAVGAGCAALLALNVLVPLPTITLGTTARSEAAMRRMHRVAGPRDTVISVPADCDPTFEAYQVVHETPITGCAGSFAANPWRSKMRAYGRSAAFAKLRCDRGRYGRLPTTQNPTDPFGAADVARLRHDFGVRFAIIDRDRAAHAICPSVREAIAFLSGYRTLGGDRRLTVVDLARPSV
jgi:hypothetical protein